MCWAISVSDVLFPWSVAETGTNVGEDYSAPRERLGNGQQGFPKKLVESASFKGF